MPERPDAVTDVQLRRRDHRRGAAPRALLESLGHTARAPQHIPWRGWRLVLLRTWREISSDRIGLVAAGCAFWATLSLFPAITMLISLYGLMFDPLTVEPQLQTLRDLLPPAAFTLIADRVHELVSKRGSALGLSLGISTVVALWSSSTGTKSLLSALNMAYEERETRGFLRFQAIGLALTFCGVLGAVLGLVILLGLAPVVDFLGLSSHGRALARYGSLAILMAFVSLALSLLYRFGPNRRAARWRWITPGSLLATLLWLIASILFSYYVGHLASYDVTYGPLGAVAGVMMWFWVSAYVALAGAELNAELELQTAQDTTEGEPRPMGERGAFVADHVADPAAEEHERR